MFLTLTVCRRGNLCEAQASMRPNDAGFNQTASERYICDLEYQLEIQNIQFEVFERCIKRFGYCIALTDDCWRATVAETHIDVEKFKEHGNV